MENRRNMRGSYMNIIVFGIGNGMKRFIHRINNDVNIVCYADNFNKVNNINGKAVIHPNEIKNYSYDYIIICSQYYKEIEKQLKAIGISENKILSYYYYWEDKEYYENKNRIILKYMRKKGKKRRKNEILDYDEKKKQYNNYYSQKIDRWSEVNYAKCQSIVEYLINNIELRLNYISENTKLLDVGCAKGNFSNAFQEQGFLVTGIDCSEVAIDIARNNFNKCKFKVMDGFNPNFLDEKFSIIFMRGFSGFNTHNIKFVTDFVDKYCELLIDEGIFIIGYSSDFSGEEIENETANWTKNEIYEFASEIPCKLINILYPDYENNKMLLAYKEKMYYYLVFKK